jgi:2,4-dienoyl-CoA reductase-like NADH-dependent reductase (Old Yellow Enzyme family)
MNAIEAGFDGVEVQAANSHLIDQFLQDGTNERTDIYGGSAENRIRFLLEIVDKVSAAIDPNRLGVRLSPFGQYGGIHDSDPLHLYGIAINALDERQIAYLHLIERRGSEIGLTESLHEGALNNARLFRSNFRGPLISAAAYTPSSASGAVVEGASTNAPTPSDSVGPGRTLLTVTPVRATDSAMPRATRRAPLALGGKERPSISRLPSRIRPSRTSARKNNRG